MTQWPAGTRSSDGVWASHGMVWSKASTGFAAPSTEAPLLDPVDQALASRMQAHYDYGGSS